MNNKKTNMSHMYYTYLPRCFTCGKIIGNLQLDYEEAINEDPSLNKEILFDKLGLKRYCCRRSFMNPTPDYHNLEDRSIVNGEVSVIDGKPFYDKSARNIRSLKDPFSSKMINSIDINNINNPNTIEETEKKKKNIESKIDLPDFDLEEEEEEIIFEEAEIKEIEPYIKLPDKLAPGVPVIINYQNILHNNTYEKVPVGELESNKYATIYSIKMSGLVYLAE